MSMNFGREQALLRQRLTAAGTEELAAKRQSEFGSGVKFLGAEHAEVVTAAAELAETYPQMGRAQMTAFVRTLWGSKTYELRAVGIEILALRASLLEPPDMPFVQGLLKEAAIDSLSERIAADVLGPLVCKNKKLWKDLKKLAASTDERLRRAAVQASKAPLVTDSAVFSRFEEMVTPLLAETDPDLQKAIDEVLAQVAEQASEQVQAFAAEHGRKLKLPKKAPTAKKKA